MRIGIGYDLHRILPTIKCASILVGGVQIPCYFKVEAHSDGDVLLHALADACLGTLALGGIGQWFPDSDPQFQNIASTELLKRVLKEVNRLGWSVQQVDSIVLLEEPRLSEHFEAIRRCMASILGIELSAVSVKAKTSEGMGPIGERKAIAAHATVTLLEKNASSRHQ